MKTSVYLNPKTYQRLIEASKKTLATAQSLDSNKLDSNYISLKKYQELKNSQDQ